jgi:glucokinase
VTGTFIGVDVGGTKVAAALLSGTTMSESTLQPTCLASAEGLIEQFVSLVGEVRGDQPLEGVGIGVPSVVEFATGKVVSSANIPLADMPLREVLGERLGVPVFVDNDATVAALAEAHDESLQLVARDLVILTIGTGVGGGMVLGGRIYRGATGGAGELGHTLIGLDLSHGVPEPGDFPQKGSLEWEAAGHALDRVAQEEAVERPDSALGKRFAAGESVLGPDAVKAAREGDQAALRMCEEWGCRIGIGVANVINTFDPQEVVIGGGGAQAGDLILKPAERVARQWVLPGLGGKTTIRLARHGVAAGVLGAALLAEQELGQGEERTADNGSVQTTEVSG